MPRIKHTTHKTTTTTTTIKKTAKKTKALLDKTLAVQSHSKAALKKATGEALGDAGAMGLNKIRKKRKARPGTVALREIRKYQKSVDFCIRKTPFLRLVREVMQDNHWVTRDGSPFLIQGSAAEALQIATEAFLIELLSDANRLAIYSGRETLQCKDMRLRLSFYPNMNQHVNGLGVNTTSRPGPTLNGVHTEK